MSTWCNWAILSCLCLCRPVQAASAAPFRDVTAESGMDFVHVNGMTGKLYYPEVFGSGVGLIDYDGDGDLDVYLVQGGPLGPGATGEPRSDRLFRNELVERGKLRFTDVTAASGIRATGYGMGVAIGDYDNDGRPDIYVTNLEANQLWRNLGDGTFADVTAKAGVGDPDWSSGATFFDYDADGDLDLFVVNYVAFLFGAHRPCSNSLGAPEYCGPATYRSLLDRLYRNNGDGTFADVSAESRIARLRGAGLGVVAHDFNEDGRPDLYVSNDGEPNRLWLNRGDGTFVDEALLAGCALNEEGRAEAGMGIVVADLGGDGRDDLFVTHLSGETNTYYAAHEDGGFDDRSTAAGLALPSRSFTGFGVAALDYDNDGWIDLAVVNGAVKSLEAQLRAGSTFPLAQRDQLFRNDKGRFVEVDGGGAFAVERVGRGLAAGDLDNDGDTDLIVSNNHGPARLLSNEIGAAAAWIGFRVDGAVAVEVVLDDGRTLTRRVSRDGSYLSSGDPRVLIGLGTAGLKHVRVRWSDGAVETWPALESRRYHTLRRGGASKTP
jgi:hypothetical protein